MKPVVWLGDGLARVREFAPDAKREAGHQLGLVQAGEEPSDWKPMPSVGLGVNEIRVRAAEAYRVIYMAKLAEAVYVSMRLRRNRARPPGWTSGWRGRGSGG